MTAMPEPSKSPQQPWTTPCKPLPKQPKPSGCPSNKPSTHGPPDTALSNHHTSCQGGEDKPHQHQPNSCGFMYQQWWQWRQQLGNTKRLAPLILTHTLWELTTGALEIPNGFVHSQSTDYLGGRRSTICCDRQRRRRRCERFHGNAGRHNDR